MKLTASSAAVRWGGRLSSGRRHARLDAFSADDLCSISNGYAALDIAAMLLPACIRVAVSQGELGAT